MEVISINCPGCGASITTHTKVCEYCHRDILVRSFHSLSSMPLPQVNKYMATYKVAAAKYPTHNGVNASIGLCFLKLKQYEQALVYFERAQADNFEDATPFFYAAVARLKGRKPFLCSRPEINQIESDINAAISIEPSAEKYYFLAYVGHDYFKRKFLKHKPEWEYHMAEAMKKGLSYGEVEEFHGMIGTPVMEI